MTRTLIVTGCDAAHYELVADLVASLRDARGQTISIGFIHVGADIPPDAITAAVDHMVHVADEQFRIEQRQGFSLAYLMVKPRIPELFPGYDIYVWMDGDTWMQNATGLDQLVHCASLADICMHPELDPNYFVQEYPRDYMNQVYVSIYGSVEARRFSGHHMLNSGVFAARAISPVWRLWGEALADVRDRGRDRNDICFSDQIPLHRLIVSGHVSVCPLRAVNNWLVGLCAPAVDLQRKRLLAPSFPFEEINILHLVATSKNAVYRLGPNGRQITFRYRDIKALFQG